MAPQGVPAGEFKELSSQVLDQVELLRVFHAGKLRVHELALELGWDAVHPRLRITKPFYDRFVPAISTRDFAIRPGNIEAALDFVATCRR